MVTSARSLLKVVMLLELVCLPVLLVCGGQTYAEVPLDTLAATYEFGGESADYTLDRPYAITVLPDRTLIIANTYANNLLRLDPRGDLISVIGDIGSGPGEFNRPKDIRRSGDRFYVADQGNKRVCLFDSAFNWLGSVSLPVRVDYLIPCPNGSVLATCTVDKPGPFLFYHINREGELLDTTGVVMKSPPDNWHLRTALNTAIGCWADDKTFVTVYRGLGAFGLGDNPREQDTVILISADLNWPRYHFYEQNLDLFGDRVVDTTIPFTLDDMIRDLVVLNQGRGRFSEYVSDITPYRGGFLVLASSIIQQYDNNGVLKHRYLLTDRFGEQIYAANLSVDAEGRIYALDTFYTYRCRVFDPGISHID